MAQRDRRVAASVVRGPVADLVAALATRLRWLVAPVRVVSGTGWLAAVGAGLGLGFGVRYGWAEFIALGAALTTMLLVALAWVVGSMAFEARIELTTARVTVGQRAVGRVLVRNSGRRSVLARAFELPVGAGVGSFDVPALPAGSDHESLFSVPGRRRSVVTIGPVRSVRADPLGLLRRVRRWSDPVQLFVHPQTVPLHGTVPGVLRDLEGVTTRNLTSSDVAFYALRDYVRGDDRRAVHWRTTARTGRLMVRQFEEIQRSHLLLVLSQRLGDYATADEFELAVSSVASLASQAAREDRQCSLYCHEGLVTSGSVIGLLDRLCSVDTDAEADPLPQLATAAAAAVPQASIAVLVTGGQAPVADLRLAGIRLPVQLQAVALRCAVDSALSRRRLGDLTVLDVPELDDLPRAMRSAR